MKKKNRAFYHYFIPVIYAVFVYILWELTGTLVAYVVGMVVDNWEQKSRFRKKRKKKWVMVTGIGNVYFSVNTDWE